MERYLLRINNNQGYFIKITKELTYCKRKLISREIIKGIFISYISREKTKKIQSAQIINNYIRGCISREKTKKTQSAQIINNYIRGCISREKTKKTQSAQIINNYIRGYISREKTKKTQSAQIINNYIRGYVSREKTRKIINKKELCELVYQEIMLCRWEKITSKPNIERSITILMEGIILKYGSIETEEALYAFRDGIDCLLNRIF